MQTSMTAQQMMQKTQKTNTAAVMTTKTKQAGRKSRRSIRYGQLVRGWSWRTTLERLERMEGLRKRLGISKTEFLEMAIDRLLSNAL